MNGFALTIYRNGFKHCMERKLRSIKRLPTKRERTAALKQAEKDCKRRH
jgi:hypothetical protein